ncbi:MAG: hypothetical protein KDE34_14970 [Anaerolineales bacterium]|nr:hypothetical protein [Anaerolineales bacterium]
MKSLQLTDVERDILQILAEWAYRLEPFVTRQVLLREIQVSETELDAAIGRLLAVEYVEQTHNEVANLFITAEGWQRVDMLNRSA